MNTNALPPSLDTWTIFFLLAAGQGILFTLALFSKQEANKTPNRLLGCYTLAFAISLIDYVGYWTRYNVYVPWFSGVYEYLVFLFGPLLWLYFKAVFGEINRRSWLNLMAPLIFFLLKFANWDNWFSSPKLFLTAQAALMILHISIYGILSVRHLRAKISDGTLSSIQAKWYWVLISLYGGFLLGWIIYFIFVYTPMFSLLLDYSIALAMTVFIYTTAFLGYKRPEIFQGVAFSKLLQQEKYASSSLTPAAAESLWRKIQVNMEEKKPFLDPALRLGSFAKQLDASSHHVSQAINMIAGKNFADYINNYRFEYAKMLLSNANDHEIMVTEAMYAAGFNNKTTFNRIFKEQTGMTPTAYMATNKKGQNRFAAT